MSNNYYQTPQSEVNQLNAGHAATLGEIKSCLANNGINWVSESWRMFKLQPLIWIAIFLVYMVIMTILWTLPLVSIFSGIIAPLFSAGWMIAAYNCDTSGEVKLDNLFAGFSAQTGALLILGVISFVLQLAIMIALGVALVTFIGINQIQDIIANPQLLLNIIPVLSVFSLLYVTLLIPIIMMLWFAPVLVVRHNIEPWDAMKRSFTGCMRNILPLTLYSLLFLALIFLACIPFFIGLLVVIPMIFISGYTAYKDIYLTTN